MEKYYCCVPECHSSYNQRTNKLYLMPRLQDFEENNHQNNQTAKNKRANERRHQWIMNTGCLDSSPADMYVCQKHFVKGNY